MSRVTSHVWQAQTTAAAGSIGGGEGFGLLPTNQPFGRKNHRCPARQHPKPANLNLEKTRILKTKNFESQEKSH